MGVNHLLDLPIDTLIEIFKLLSLKDLSNLMLTCVKLKNLIFDNNLLWKYVTRHDLIIEDRNYPFLSRYHTARMSYNWRSGIYNSKQIVKLGKKFMPWIKFCPDIFLLSVGSELRCYSVTHGMPKCRKILWKLSVPKVRLNDIRTNDISRFAIKDTLLVCGYRDGSVNLYKVDDHRTQPRLVEHLTRCHNNGYVEVSCVDVICNPSRSFMVTGSDRSNKIAFWHWPSDDGSFETINENPIILKFKEVILTGYHGARSLALNDVGDKVAIGPEGSDMPLCVDTNTMTVIPHRSPRMCGEIVRDITWHDANTVAYVNHSSTLGLLDIRSQELIYEQKDPFFTPLYCVKTDGNNAVVVGSAQYSRCVLYDRRMKSHVQMYFTQKERSPVYGLDFSCSKLLAAIDRSVGMVDFNLPINSSKPRDYSSYVFFSDHQP